MPADDAQPEIPSPPAAANAAPDPPGSAGVTATMGADQIRRFVAQAARIATARAVGFAAVDAALLAGGAGIIAVAGTAWSLRGDLAAIAWTAIALGLGVALVALAAWRSWRRYGRPTRAAGEIARCRLPLSRDPSETMARQERLLRHEILGALELAEAPEHPIRSSELCTAYVEDVAARLRSHRIEAGRALPKPRAAPRAVALAALGIATLLGVMSATAMGGLTLLWTATDGRPPAPPEPVWSTLTLELDYPPHTRRARRIVPNPSGALRVVAGTEVHIQLTGRRAASAARVVVNYDATDLNEAPEPDVVDLQLQPEAGQTDAPQFVGSYVAHGSGTWTVVLLDDEDDDHDDASRRSPAMPLQLEPDRPPEVELLPLPRGQREVSETDNVDVRFVARDDFGLVRADLVYQLPDGATHRLSTGTPSGPTRTWRHRYTWDIAQIPIAERSEVLYWVEVRDNDPGLHIDPLPDPPGKVTRSATMRLIVKDDEAEHAANIAKLAEIRDAAVDLLAIRMTTRAFGGGVLGPAAPPPPLGVRVASARDLLHRSGAVLAMIADTIDALSVDTLTRERDVNTLSGVHARLMKLHRAELGLHEALPPGVARARPADGEDGLRKLGPHNTKEIAQLEDEIIRLDDLVDGQIVERLEALVARLEATQRKLVELLEQLQAGDESVRPQIDQLEQRRREDLRRIAEARAMLQREVDEEFMNLDAFKLLQEMQRREQLSEMLRRGELDEAVEQARGQLGDVQRLRDEVQDRIGKGAPGADNVSEEDRKRMKLLRELSRLQDEEGGIRAQTKGLDKRWREAIGDQEADAASQSKAGKDAKSLRKALEKINDARLSRDGRRGLEDARDALQQLERLSEDDAAKQLDLADAARKAAEGLQRAAQGSEAREDEGKALRRAQGKAQGLQGAMGKPLPGPGTVLSEEDQARLDELGRRQQGLRKRVDDLMGNDLSQPLPAPGRKALRGAGKDMQGSAAELGQEQPYDALQQQSSAWDGLQKAIDSLRRASPPPPAASSSGDASTEAERDRSLRDALMEAMREGAPDGYGESVKRYYEELLR